MATTQHSKPTPTTKLTAADADRIARKVRRAPALFKREEIEDIYSKCVQRDWVFRAALAFLTEPGKETIRRAKEGRDYAETAAAWSKAADAWVKDMKFRCDIVETLQRRVLVALAHREDMVQILDEARHQDEAGAKGGAA